RPSISQLGYAVFHLPRVVERVPRGAPRRVWHGPLLLPVGIAKASAEADPKALDRGGVIPGRLLLMQADLLRVLDFGREDVLEHLVAIPAAATRSLLELRRRLGAHLFEVLPARLHDRCHALSL